MSFWAGIKHAINSTLGTDKFQPLDELIKGGTKLVASYDYVLTPLAYNSQAGASEIISFSDGGAVYFSVVVDLNPPKTDSAFATITVKKKNESGQWEEVGKKSITASSGTTGSTQRVYVLADIIPNEVYRFEVSYKNASVDQSSGEVFGIPISAYLEITKS